MLNIWIRRRIDICDVMLKNKNLVVFFTYKYSLELWHKAGIISREGKPYNELSKYLSEIYLVTYGDVNEASYRRYLSDNVKILFNKLNLHPLLYSLLVPITYRWVLRRADVYKTHQLWGSWPALIAKLLYRKKLVIRQGYQLSLFLKRQNASLIRRFFVWLLELLSYYLADRIVVTSQNDKKYIAKYHVNPAKIVVIPNYVDTELFRPLDGIDKSPRRIIFVGRLDPQKNLSSLLDAVKGLDVELMIIGDGPLRTELSRKVKAEKISNIKFLSIIPNERLPFELNKAELFVLPSLYEGNPKALLEAMACGLPVIGTNVKGVKEIIKNGVNGLICETDSKSIKRAILFLLNNQELNEKLSLNARYFIKKNYSLDNALKKELILYLHLLNEAP
jgi:glycosyltransferase involved in cell wall biosynthesis